MRPVGRWSAALMLVTISLSACGAVQKADPAVQAAEQRAAQLAAANDAASPVASPSKRSSSATPRSSIRPTTPPPAPLSTVPPSQVAVGPAPETSGSEAGATSGGSGSNSGGSGWSNYPWPPNDDGKACSAPVLENPGADNIVALVGDSLIRNSRESMSATLRASGFEPVYVCWGGKTTRWGIDQIGHMRDLGITPRCLVLNLGTNDVKNDGVTAVELESRLESLLAATSDIAHVMVVDIWANTDLAPSTMSDVSSTVAVYPQAVEATGKGTVISWAAQARNNPGLVGDDGVHDSSDGESVRTGLIADAVVSHCG